MNIDDALRQQVIATFAPLNSVAAANAFPPPSTLSKTLEGLIPAGAATTRNITVKDASYFSTAAVDIWLRSVHSFLVSASLTSASPIWASVSGYYSSHYSVRGLAHILGYFQLFKRKKIVELKVGNAIYRCHFKSKNRQDAEHKFYWKTVKDSPVFSSNDLFTENKPDSSESDVRHRNHANYADHLSLYPVFHALSDTAVVDRVDFISKISFTAPPLPRFDKFPDVEYVQLIAYHRLVTFRRLLDDILGDKNRFWNKHRNPAFAVHFMNFQLTEGRGAEQPSAH
jgi:hypothetical protein